MFKKIKEQFSKTKKLAKKQPNLLNTKSWNSGCCFPPILCLVWRASAVEEQVLVEDIVGDVQAKLEAAAQTVEQTAAETRRELVLVNENVADYEQLIADLQGRR